MELGSGTSTAGRPAAASSITVEAPARVISRCAWRSRCGTSSKNGFSSTFKWSAR
jgi:hypothetical protein